VGRIVSRRVVWKAAFLLAFLQNRIVFPVDTYRDTVVDTTATKKADSPMSIYVSFFFKLAFEKCSFHILQLVGSSVSKLPTASPRLADKLGVFQARHAALRHRLVPLAIFRRPARTLRDLGDR
jgi:hypothetical protein